MQTVSRGKSDRASHDFSRSRSIQHAIALTAQTGLVDSFRHLNPSTVRYSWFSYRAQARVNNRGWRIDYFLTSRARVLCNLDSLK
jgi:exonuclease III